MSGSSDPTRWELVDRLFSRALELPGHRRIDFVEKECSGDPELRNEVLALLESSESSGEYLLHLAARAGAPASPGEQLGRLAGKKLGAWRLVELIGRGGMGAVYLAERDDEQFRMRAALKILPLGVSSDDQRRRFLSERQILARLNHPSIARILDGGVTEDGTPFYVMEHVEGVPIDRYCDQHRLPIEERLVLFEGVCHAVQHAHRNLIVHQDLKPGNILVTNEAQVKLLDFGIARILESEESGACDATGPVGRAMTLAYASPEQVRGEPVSTVSDVYSLGLILYELLAGRHPYRHEMTEPTSAVSVVTSTVPPAPSGLVTARTPMGDSDDEKERLPEAVAERRGTNPARLKRALAGDLDTIVLMALRKEPERRYASVADLSLDLRNYRHRLPVSARPDSVSYRLSRFLRRNLIPASLSAVAVLFMLGLAATSLRSAARERAQAQVIRQEAARAEAVTNFLVGLFEFTEAPDGLADTIRARTLVDRGAARIIESLDDQPETRIQILGALSRVYGNLGLIDEEVGLLEEALRILRTDNHQDELVLARYLRRLADARRGSRNFELAGPYYRETLEILRRHPEDPLELARALMGSAANDAALGRPEPALVRNAEAIDLFRRGEGGEALATLRARADRGIIFRAAEQPDSAMAIYESLLPVLREKGDSARFLLATVLNNLGYLSRTQGDFYDAESRYREALSIERELNLPVRLLTLLNNLASTEEKQGQLDDAKEALLERLAVAHRAWPEGHWRVGQVEGAIALFHLRHGRPRDALPYARNQLESYRVQIAEEHAWTTEARVVLGVCLLELDRFEEAEPYLLKGYEALVASQGLEHPRTQELVQHLVTLYQGWNKPAEESRFRQLLSASPDEGGSRVGAR